MDLLHRMTEAMKKGHAPEEFESVKVQHAIHQELAHARARHGSRKAAKRPRRAKRK